MDNGEFNKILLDLDNSRPLLSHKAFSEHQAKFLMVAREIDPPVTFPNIAEQWKKFAWGDKSGESIRKAYKKYRDDFFKEYGDWFADFCAKNKKEK